MRVTLECKALPLVDETWNECDTPPGSGHYVSKKRGGNTRAITASSEKLKRKAKTLKGRKARQLALSKTIPAPLVVTPDDMRLQFQQSIADDSHHPTVSAWWCPRAQTAGDVATTECMKIQNAGYSGMQSPPETPHVHARVNKGP